MIFDDKESPQFEFNDPSEFYNLINRKYAVNADPGYADFKQNEDMINYSNPDEHPDWAKEINEKRGVSFVPPAPIETASIENESSSKNPNIPELFNKLSELKNKNNSPDLESEPKEEPSRSPASIFSEDEIYEMSRNPKPVKTLPMDKEIGEVQSQIDRLTSQNINDSSLLVPLYNKLGTLKTIQKSVIDAQSNEIKPTYYDGYSNKPPTSPNKVEESPSQPLSLKSKLDLDKDWEEIAAGVGAAAGNKTIGSSGIPKFNPLSAEDRRVLFDEVTPGSNISSKDEELKAAPDRAVYDRPIPKVSSADERISKLEEKIQKKDQDEANELQNLVNLEKQKSEMNKQALYEAQSDAADYRRYNALFSALNKIGAGIGGAISKTKIEVPELDPILEKAADQRMKDYKERVAMEQEDPDSLYSKSFRNFAKPLVKKLNMNPMILEGLSGKQISDILPHVKSMYDTQVTAEYRTQIAENARAERALRREEALDTKENLKTIDRFDKAGKLLVAELASGRSTFGTDARTLAATQNIRALFQGRDLNDLDSREVYEVAKSLDRVLSQTGATISGTKSLTPDTARGWLSKAMEYVTNKRQGANAESFLKQFENNLQREEKTAEERIKKTQRRVLTSFSDLQQKDPAKWKLMMRQSSLPEDPFEEEKPAPKLGPDEIMGRDSKTGRPVILNRKTKKVRWAD